MSSAGNTHPRRIQKNRAYRVIVVLGTMFLRLLAVRRDVRGLSNLPAGGGAVLAITHFSYLDFVLAEWAVFGHRRRYVRFMATLASFQHPVAGPLMRSMGHIPVDRSAGASAYRFAIDALQRGEMVGVFPETRVSRSFTLLPFKNGAVRMAARSGVPIVPCVIWGSHRISTRTHKTSLWKSRRTPVTISFGEALTVRPQDDATVVTQALRVRMEAMLAAVQADYPVEGASAWWQPAHLGGTAPSEDLARELDTDEP